MKITIIYSLIIICLWVLGMALDVAGLYVSVQFATRNKVRLSKFGFFTMRIGEILEKVASESMIAIPLLIVLLILKVI